MSERHEVQVHRVGIPTGEPPKRIFRPESEVKAEALRLAADDYEEFGSDDESVASWLRQRAAVISPRRTSE